MRKALAGIAVLSIVAAAGGAQPGKSEDTSEFKGLIERYWKAWSTLNPDTAAPMYSKDADAVYYDVSPLKYNGWEEYKQGVLKVFAGSASASITPNDDLRVTRRGDIAWTSETFHAAIVEKDGRHWELVGRHTAIWEKRAGHWTIVHEHVSAPLPG